MPQATTNRYAALTTPAPVWSIFDYAAALFVEPVLEGASLMGSFRATSRKIAARPTTTTLPPSPRRPLSRWPNALMRRAHHRL